MASNIYAEKNRWKWLLFVGAVIIGSITFWYTNSFVRELREVERRKVRLWAEATRQINDFQEDNQAISFVFEVIRDNKTVPVILTDQDGMIKGFRNLDSAKADSESYLREQITVMKSQHEPIVIDYDSGNQDIIYYKDSILLLKLQYFPLIMLIVIALFIGVAYYAFSNSRRSEQNRVWAGMARETAHQIGTPLSSLMGWLEILRSQSVDESILTEVEKDIRRLDTITDRFSKIGSRPNLKENDVVEVTQNAVDYLKRRVSSKIKVEFYTNVTSLIVPLNASLYEWVIENLVKNGIDAISGEGQITVEIQHQGSKVLIDVTDTGKGLRKSQFQTVFRPGFTTKKRGWGLGLSLAKRIVEEYHGGKIIVYRSERGKGTTFRTTLNV
jgi:signal transduction histidine kinase